MQKNIIILSLTCLIIGFICSYFIFGYNPSNTGEDDASGSYQGYPVADTSRSVANPFRASNGSRLDIMENEVALIKQQLQEIELAIENLSTMEDTGDRTFKPATTAGSRFTSAYSQRIYNLDQLIKGGLDPALAEDIVRRKNSVELKRLELQDRATRENYLDTQRYYDELALINSMDISLRDELGDQRYDEYLYNSKQNNRIRISSVMLESAAERAGILSGDIVLSYDNQRMFSWQELKDATSEGQLGDYVSISIYRDGEIFSFSVPRGPLGVQLGAARLPPG